MNKYLKKIKLLGAWILTHLTPVSIGLSIILILGIGIFLYKNFYLTIISAKEIIILQKDISVGSLRIDLLETIENNYQNKLGFSSNFKTDNAKMFQTNEFDEETVETEPEPESNIQNNPPLAEENANTNSDEPAPIIAAPKTTF